MCHRRALRFRALSLTSIATMKPRATQCTAAVLTIATCASLVGGQALPRGRWIATWTASMFQVPPRNVFLVTGQTIRQSATITLGGERVRIRLSNEYGDRPIRVGSAAIALADTGAMVVDGSSRSVTFGGRSSIVVGPGAIVVSDPVAWKIPALSTVAVSLYFPDTTFESTLAVASPQISYTSKPGNFAAASVLPVDWGRPVWMFLTGVDVDNPQARGAIVALGSSLIGGSGPGISVGARWPDVLTRRLHASPQGLTMSVLTATINGNQLLANHRTPPSLGRFSRDVLGQPGVTHVIVLEGNNDITMGAVNVREPVTAADVIFGLTQIATRAHDHNLTAIVGTLPPFEGATYDTTSMSYGQAAEGIRRSVNAWIRGNAVFDGVVDFDACVQDPAHPTRLHAMFDSGDHIHLNDAGFRAMGECIDLRPFVATRRRAGS
jgi:lysophospholipase L1-like esterase